MLFNDTIKHVLNYNVNRDIESNKKVTEETIKVLN